LSIAAACNTAEDTVCRDLDAPIMTLLGASEVELEAQEDIWVDPGWSASDTYDGDLSTLVKVVSTLVSDGAAVLNISSFFHPEGFVSHCRSHTTSLTFLQ
jgi:hypothetical protein